MKVLVAVDRSSASRDAVKSALELASELEEPMELELVHCITPVLTMNGDSYDESLEEAEQNGRDALDTAVETINGASTDLKSLEKELLHTNDSNVVDALTKHIEENDFDMVFMGHRNHSKKTERFVGSTTKKLISRSDVPVVAV